MDCVTTMDKKQQTKLLSYFIMGDGGVYIVKQNAKFIMNMRAVNQDYINWVDSVLKNVTGTKQYVRKDYNTDGCQRASQIRLESKCHPEFTKLRERIYTDSYKGIDPHALKLLDWEAMAILYMCDGGLNEDKPCAKKGLVNSSWNLTLNMKRLSYGDHLLLKRAIKEKLGMEFNINRQGKYYYLRLRTKDVEAFCKGVLPYMTKSFMYKVRMIDSCSQAEQDGEIVCSQ